MKDPQSIIQTIRLTEKATMLGETNNEYVFVVHPKANKLEIKQAVESTSAKKSSVSAQPTMQAKPVANVELILAAPTTGKKPSFV